MASRRSEEFGSTDIALRFQAFGELGRLVKLLRMLGLDCAYDGGMALPSAILQAVTEERVLLTCLPVAETPRLRVLLIKGHDPDQQLLEVVTHLPVRSHTSPFTRCLHCNELLLPVAKGELTDFVSSLLSPPLFSRGGIKWGVIPRGLPLNRCPSCGRLFWEGSHVQRMRRRLEELGVLSPLQWNGETPSPPAQ